MLNEAGFIEGFTIYIPHIYLPKMKTRRLVCYAQSEDGLKKRASPLDIFPSGFIFPLVREIDFVESAEEPWCRIGRVDRVYLQDLY